MDDSTNRVAIVGCGGAGCIGILDNMIEKLAIVNSWEDRLNDDKKKAEEMIEMLEYNPTKVKQNKKDKRWKKRKFYE